MYVCSSKLEQCLIDVPLTAFSNYTGVNRAECKKKPRVCVSNLRIRAVITEMQAAEREVHSSKSER